MLKSLEIVNKEIEQIENELQKIENEEDTLFPFDILMCDLKRYSKIKQDLEVLDLLLPYLFEVDSDNGEPLIGMYDLINRDLSITDRFYIKIWLEFNKVGDSNG